MLRITSTLTLGLLILSGCPGDDTGDTAASAGTTTDNPPGTTTDNPPGTTIGSADTTEGPATTDTPASTTDEPGTTTDEPETTGDDTTTGAGEVCAPAPEDDECGTCVKDMCCAALEACQMDADCTCFQDCAEMNPGIAGALLCADGAHCDIPIFELMMMGTPVGDLAVCTQNSCPVCLM